MSAVIQNEYTGNNSTTTYSFTFPYLKTSDIKASLDGVETTAFTLPNATTLQFNTAPSQDVKIKIFRETSVDDLTATFYAGSAIKSEDLNDNFTQNLYKTQEVGARAISALGGTMTGNLTLDTQADLVFEGSSADDHETTIKVVNPTADRTITFPNVTGTVVTTGDTGTVATGMIANDAITNAKIANDQIDSQHYVDGSIDTQHIANAQVTEAKIASGAVTNTKIANNSLDQHHYQDGSIKTVHITDANITTDKLAADAVTNAKIANNSIDSEHYVDGSIDNAHLANNSVTQAKMADDSVGTAELVDSSVDTARLADNAVTLAKMADNSVGTSEIVNDAVTNAKIANNSIDSEHYVDGSIDTAHISTGAITTAKISNSQVTSTKIADGNVNTNKLASSSVTTNKIANDAVTTVKIPDDAVTTAKIADSELKTLAGMQSGTASKLADSTALTADIADLNQIDGLTKQTTISDSDASFPTSGAVVDYVAAQIAPLGGLEVIATEVAFPNTQPQAGVVISISDAGGVVFNGSGTSTTGRTVGGSTVTINNAPSSLNSETLVAGVGLMVSSTGSGQVYNYHKILGKEDDIKQLSDDINDFNARYRVGSSNPTSALDAGDLFFNTSTSKLLVYNATNTAWEEAQSIGNFFISTLSPAFDGSTQDFTITNAPSNAQQILLSINGVVQKPNAGTSTPSEGFALSGSTVKLAAAPASGSIYHAVVLGSTVNIGTPSNNTVSTAVLQNSSVTTAKIADDAVTTAKIATDAVTSDSINDDAVTQAHIATDAIVTANIVDDAVTSAKIADGTIVNANVNSSAAIAGSKIAPDFGSQNVVTTGNVGIGTTSPSDNLDIASNHSQLRLTDTDDSKFVQFSYSGGKLITRNNSTNTTTAQFTLDESGRLGIGTTSPDTLFHLSGADTAIIRLENTDDSLVANQIIGGLEFEKTDPNGGGAGVVGGLRMYSQGVVGENTYLTLSTSDSSTNNVERMRITATGRVGINENGPTKTLVVSENDSECVAIIKSSDTGTAGLYLGGQTDEIKGGILFNNTTNELTLQGNNNAQRAVIDTSGNFKINSGNLVIGTAGKGIDFSNNSNATGMSNELFDDYEEGTWTPASNGGYTTQSTGSYTKIGKMVYAAFNIDISSNSDAGHATIQGLPFAVENANPNANGVAPDYQTYDVENGPIYHLGKQQTQIVLYKNLGAALQHQNISQKNLRGTAIYRT